MSEAVSAGKVEIEGLVTSSAEEVKGFLKEGEELLKKGDVVQASEKIYKAAEDTVKILAKEHAPEVYDAAEQASRENRRDRAGFHIFYGKNTRMDRKAAQGLKKRI